MKRSSNLWAPNGPIKRHRNNVAGQVNGQMYSNFQVQIAGAYNSIPPPPHLMSNGLGVLGAGPSSGYHPPTSFPVNYRQFPQYPQNTRYQPHYQPHYQIPNERANSPRGNYPSNRDKATPKSDSDVVVVEDDNEKEKEDLFPKITQSMMEYVRTNGQTTQLLDTKFRLRGEFEQHLRRLFPNCDLFIFGSSASGFGSKSSDMDMCLVTNNNVHLKDVKLLYRVKSVLCSLHPLVDVQVINAKVPILKFVHKPTEIQCDLNINNSDGVRNTHLLKFFTKCDPRFVPLVLTLKRWARHHKINDASQGTLSSYALTLMMLHFLQVGVRPPVLPNLIRENPDVFHPRRSLQSLSFHDPINGNFISLNKSTVGELFVGFLTYFSKQFDYGYTGISVREARAVAKRTDREFSKWIYIEEPYNMDNVARAVRKNYERYIKQVFDRSYFVIHESKDLESLFDFTLQSTGAVVPAPGKAAGNAAASSSAAATSAPPDKLKESPVDKEFDDSAASDNSKISPDPTSSGTSAQASGESNPDFVELDAAATSEVSELYQLAAKRSLQVAFDVIGESGPPHLRNFSTRCTVTQKKGPTETLLAATGKGNNKKASKLAAAKEMLAILDKKKIDVSKKESFP